MSPHKGGCVTGAAALPPGPHGVLGFLTLLCHSTHGGDAAGGDRDPCGGTVHGFLRWRDPVTVQAARSPKPDPTARATPNCHGGL